MFKHALAMFAALTVAGAVQAADNYPSRNLDFIIAYSAGGGNDLISRALAPAMEKELGVQVVPTNLPGASGATGAKKVLSIEPGYAFATYSKSLVLIQYTGFSKLNIKDFTPVAQVVDDTAIVTVPADSPYKTLADLVADAKKNPGKVKMGNAGTGGLWHLAIASLAKKTGATFEDVPYKGGRPALIATAGHEIDATVTNIAEAAALLENKSLRVVGVLSDERSDAFPDVATAKEQGIDMAFPVWRGIFTAAGGPKERTEKLAAAIKAAMRAPKFQEFVKTSGLVAKYRGPDEFAKLVADEDALYSDLLATLGLKVADPNKK